MKQTDDQLRGQKMPFPFFGMQLMPFPFWMNDSGSVKEKTEAEKSEKETGDGTENAFAFPFFEMLRGRQAFFESVKAFFPFPAEKGEGKGSVPPTFMNICTEILRQLMTIDVSPEELADLQKLLDFVFAFIDKKGK